MTTFTVTGLSAGYQGHPVVEGVDLTVAPGEAVALAGRNGMGKTTTLRAVMGLGEPRVSAGSVRFGDVELTGRAPHDIARAGIGYVPQGRRIFRSLTVAEHLAVVARPAPAGYEPWTVERVFALFPRLAERVGQRAGTLSGGEQQMLAIARALMTNPGWCCSTSPAKASPRGSCARSATSSGSCTPAGSGCCSRSRTCRWSAGWPTGSTSSIAARSPRRSRRASSARATTCSTATWVSDRAVWSRRDDERTAR